MKALVAWLVCIGMAFLYNLIGEDPAPYLAAMWVISALDWKLDE